MPKKTKIKIIKRIIKISIAIAVAVILVFLGFFVKYNYTFENASMEKWRNLTTEQQINTLNRVVSDYDNEELLLQCVTKISQIPDSQKMDIRDAIVICYNGIKINQDEK